MKYRHFWKCCFKYWYYFAAGIGLSYILSSVVVKGNTLIGEAIDAMLAGEQVEFAAFGGTLMIMVLVGTVAAFVRSLATSKFGIKVQTEYKALVAEKLYCLQYKYFDRNGSGAVLNKINTDISDIDILLNRSFPDMCTSLVTMVIYAVYVGRINWGLLVLMGICYPILVYVTNLIAKKVEDLRKVFKQKSDIITEISQDCVSGILVLRAFGAEDYFQDKLNQAADDLVDNEGKRVRITNTAFVIQRILQWTPNILCAVCAYVMVLRGNISMGELVIFLMILNHFVGAYIGVPFIAVEIKENMVSVGRLEEILGEEEESYGTAIVGIEGTGADGVGTEVSGDGSEIAVEFANVDFSYVEKQQVLRDLSFQIRKNSNVAFVGDSGGGKSTIFHLLCGFYQCNAGEYKLFGRNISEWDIEAARERMALVSQNVFLFPTTILENVRYGNLDATDEEIIEACKKARIHDFIMGLPEKYDSMVGERGILLSGGERQRISIARAFLKDAPILLLDEPTSAVDVATEQLIQEALFGLAQNRTCITIAHRLSTIQKADEIMVLKDGKIVEKGCHEDLIKCGGIYAGMYGRENMDGTEVCNTTDEQTEVTEKTATKEQNATDAKVAEKGGCNI